MKFCPLCFEIVDQPCMTGDDWSDCPEMPRYLEAPPPLPGAAFSFLYSRQCLTFYIKYDNFKKNP